MTTNRPATHRGFKLGAQMFVLAFAAVGFTEFVANTIPTRAKVGFAVVAYSVLLVAKARKWI